GGLHGAHRRGQVQPRPRVRAEQAHAHDLAHRLGGGGDPGSHPLDARGAGPPLSRGGGHIRGGGHGWGPGGAGGRKDRRQFLPPLADFVPMVKGPSHMALGGPPLVKAVVGEDISAEELGGSKIHTEVSGVADLEVADDTACLEAIKTYLSYFPSSNLEQPPI